MKGTLATHLSKSHEGDLGHLHGKQVASQLATDNGHDELVEERGEEKGDKHGT